MLNTVLAWMAVTVWVAAYGLFFLTDLRRWWHGRPMRRARKELEQEMARRTYAEWVRNIPPSPSRAPSFPPPVMEPPPATASPTRSGGTVIPFPRRATVSRR